MVLDWLTAGLRRKFSAPPAVVNNERVTPFLKSIPAPHQVRRALDTYTSDVIIVLNTMADLLSETEQLRKYVLSSGCIRIPACRYLTDKEMEQTKKALSNVGWIVKEVVFVPDSRRYLYYLEFPPSSGGCID